MDSLAPALEAFLLGTVDFDVTLALQQRLVEQARARGDGQVTLLLCEHPTIITIGRGGSPAAVAMQSTPVRTGRIAVRWVNRGGGTLLHCPGQLAIYPIVPLAWHGFSVGQFFRRFQAGLREALEELNVPCKTGIFPVPAGTAGASRLRKSPTPRRRPWHLWPHRATGRVRPLGSALDHLLRGLSERQSGDGLVPLGGQRSGGPAGGLLGVGAVRIGTHDGRPRRRGRPPDRAVRLRPISPPHGPSAVAEGRTNQEHHP